jgi:N utilization substance protein B
MGARRKGRILAFQSLYSYELCKTDRQLQIDEILEFPWIEARGSSESNQDSIDFGRLIARGTIENLSEVDRYITSQLEHWDFSRLNKVDQAILRISVYSLLFQQDIPASVTIDEAVDISKDFGTDDSYRFINGVLDGVRKNLEH